MQVDLDLGNYERFLDVTLTTDNNITTSKIYQSMFEKEWRGDYLGKTVQVMVVPHITDAIKTWVESVLIISVDRKQGPADVCVIELGGTVGDIESMPFIESLRQLSLSVDLAQESKKAIIYSDIGRLNCDVNFTTFASPVCKEESDDKEFSTVLHKL